MNLFSIIVRKVAVRLRAVPVNWNVCSSSMNGNSDFFDVALISDHDRIFDLESQRQFYGNKMKILPNAKHHVFFRFSSLAEILNY